jgi:hypothetical protein
MSLGRIRTDVELTLFGRELDVDAVSVAARADGFYAVTLSAGRGYATFRFVLDSSVPGRWYAYFDGIITCELDDPDVLSQDAAFACDRIEIPLDASIDVHLDPPLGGLRRARGLRLLATLDMADDAGSVPVSTPRAFAFRVGLDLDDGGCLELDRAARWVLHAPGRAPVEDVRFTADVRAAPP